MRILGCKRVIGDLAKAWGGGTLKVCSCFLLIWRAIKKAETFASLRLLKDRNFRGREGRGVSEAPVLQRGVATDPLNEAIVTQGNNECNPFV